MVLTDKIHIFDYKFCKEDILIISGELLYHIMLSQFYGSKKTVASIINYK